MHLLNRKRDGFRGGEAPQVVDQLQLPLPSFHLKRDIIT